MECFEFGALLQQRLDERLAPRCAELDAHAATCPACDHLFEDVAILSRGVAAWRTGQPTVSSELSSKLTQDVLEIIRAEQPVRQTAVRPLRQSAQTQAPQIWQTWAVFAGAVAAVWFVFVGSTVQRPDQRVAAVRVFTEPSKPKADLGAVLVSAEGAYSQLANESFAAAQDFALLWPAGSMSSASPSPAPMGTGSDWSPAWSPELAPISNSVEDAWNFLRRTVPHVQKSPT